jgi:hypothetical protein
VKDLPRGKTKVGADHQGNTEAKAEEARKQLGKPAAKAICREREHLGSVSAVYPDRICGVVASIG